MSIEKVSALEHFRYRITDSMGEMLSTFFINARFKKRFLPSPEKRLDGRVAIVTGGNRGIGRSISIDLASRGAKVIIAARDTAKGEETAAEIRTKTPNAVVIVKKLDLSSFESIRNFAADILATEPRIDYLVNNAGYVIYKRVESSDKLEIMHQINCFGPLLLTMLLLERIVASDDARIVNTSSMAHHQLANFDFDDFNWKNKRSFSYFDVYGHSKLGLMLWTRLLGDKLASKNVKVYAVDPGIAPSELAANMSTFHKMVVTSLLFRAFMRSVKEAGDSVVSAVIDDSGSYKPKVNYFMVDGQFKQASPFSQSDEAAEKLWQIYKELTHGPDLPSQ